MGYLYCRIFKRNKKQPYDTTNLLHLQFRNLKTCLIEWLEQYKMKQCFHQLWLCFKTNFPKFAIL